MIASGDPASHEGAWLALPWLANGRLSQAERDKIEPHVRECAECREELAFQRLLCNALTEPDRVTYAPGPSFRKLMDRIDGAGQQSRKATEPNSKTLATLVPRPCSEPPLEPTGSITVAPTGVGLGGELCVDGRPGRGLHHSQQVGTLA